MKATELMIGDWVSGVLGDMKVVALGATITGHRLSRDGTMHETDCNPNFVEPIPLTEEILKANGFERSMTVSDTEPYDLDEEGYAYYQFGDLGKCNKHIWFWYEDNEITLPTNCTDWIYIKFVHELQHALRLCGLNVLADNFKLK